VGKDRDNATPEYAMVKVNVVMEEMEIDSRTRKCLMLGDTIYKHFPNDEIQRSATKLKTV
jgi:hypothetical protein